MQLGQANRHAANFVLSGLEPLETRSDGLDPPIMWRVKPKFLVVFHKRGNHVSCVIFKLQHLHAMEQGREG